MCETDCSGRPGVALPKNVWGGCGRGHIDPFYKPNDPLFMFLILLSPNDPIFMILEMLSH